MSLATAIFLFSIFCHVSSTNTGDQNSGNTCCSSPAGIPGIPGTHGNQGLPGERGEQGDTGRDGAPGPKGDYGPKGEIGVRLAGEKGEQGDIGRDGSPGPNGNYGPKGDIGLTGEKGEQGDTGRDGVPGKSGPFGPKGDAGLKGEKGTKGSLGPVGLPGVPGGKGSQGEQGPVNNKTFKSAFSVKLSGSGIRDLPISPIKYNNVITNIGGDYNLTTGKFVCSVSGAYVFSFTAHSYSSRDLAISIMNNNVRIASSYTNPSSGRYGSMSGMVVLQLNVGDEVWAQPYDVSSDNLYVYTGVASASFSGFLLYPST